MTLLDGALLAELERLQLSTRVRLAGRFGGEHRSSRYGNAIDFADFREYHPGDDYRRIDYHVLARLDQTLIKLYEAEDEITLRLLIDTSSSMAVGDKIGQARRLAAALGFVALTSHDAVSVHTFPTKGRPPRFSGRAAVPALFSYLESLQADGPTPFATAAGQLLSQPGPAGLTIVLSDLLTDEWENVVRLRARGSELVLIHVMALEDTEPALLGDLELVDKERSERLVVSLTPDAVADYRDRVLGWQSDVAARCRSVGGTYVAIDSRDDIERLLLTSWRGAGVVR